jgi:hypothetical protein
MSSSGVIRIIPNWSELNQDMRRLAKSITHSAGPRPARHPNTIATT